MSWVCKVHKDKQEEAIKLIPGGGWDVATSSNGSLPPTHYICDWPSPTPNDFVNMNKLGIEYKFKGPKDNVPDMLANLFDTSLIKIQDFGPSYVSTARGSKYHEPHCIHVQDKANLRQFATKQEAEDSKLKPCDTCIGA